MKRVLIISFYWPPYGGGGVQRWLKMTKFLPQYGWKPIVYTPEQQHLGLEDHSLAAQIPDEVEVITQPIWEPYDLYKKFAGRSKDDNVYSGFISEKDASFKQKLSVWIRGNFFIPDARMFWIRPSIKFLKQYLKDNPVDAIVSTGPPHSMHMIAEAVHKFTNIPWIADFRDPWTNIDFYQELNLTKWADRKHHYLEKRIIQGANEVVCVTPTMTKEFKEIGSRNIHTITNGYDPEDFTGDITLDKDFTIAHIGSMNKDRNPKVLWEALSQCCKDSEDFKRDFKMKLVGPVDAVVLDSIKSMGLDENVLLLGSLPHKDAILEMRKSRVVLLVINQSPNLAGIMPGKMFEYFGSQRPLICIGPDYGDAKEIIDSYANGNSFGYNDLERLKNHILSLYELRSSSAATAKVNDNYSRASIAGEFADLLDKLS